MQYFAIGVVSVMVLFCIVAIVDLVFLKSKWGLGREFKRAFTLIGPLVLAMTGIISFVPVIAWLLEHTLTPLYTMIGLDPSLAVTTILAMDMGGYQLACEVALDTTIGEWAGMVYGSMMGATIVFLIPVGLGAIRGEDITFFSKGILYGIVAIPFGTFVGGLMMGIKVTVLLINLIIPSVFSIIIVLCLHFAPHGTVKVFKGFSIGLDAFAVLALGIAIVKDFVLVPISNTGAFDIEQVPFFNMIAPTSEGVLISGNIGLMLAGTLPFVYVLTKLVKKPIGKFATRHGMTEIGITSFITTMANSMGMFPFMSDMTDREKVLNVSFAVCASWVIGDHLAFAATTAPHLIAPMMVAKLVSGVIALILAYVFTRDMKGSTESHVENCVDNDICTEDMTEV